MFSFTHWGRETHICVANLTIVGTYNGLSPTRQQAIIWTNAGLLSIGPLRINFSEIFIKIQNLSFTKIHLEISSAKWQPLCRVGNIGKRIHFSLRVYLDHIIVHSCREPWIDNVCFKVMFTTFSVTISCCLATSSGLVTRVPLVDCQFNLQYGIAINNMSVAVMNKWLWHRMVAKVRSISQP